MTTSSRLRTAQALSWIMVATGCVLPVVAHLEGKKPEHWPFFILVAGFVGLAYHDIVKSLHERLSKIESTHTDKT